jgi:hypothetical protein
MERLFLLLVVSTVLVISPPLCLYYSVHGIFPLARYLAYTGHYKVCYIILIVITLAVIIPVVSDLLNTGSFSY